MKKLMLIIAGILLGTVISFAQDVKEADVPSVVLNSFKKEFSKVSDVEWEVKGDVYDVEFDIGFADHEAWFDNSGKMIKHNEEIKTSNLPETILSTLNKEYKPYRVSDVKKIETGSTVVYQLDLKNGNEEWEMLFASNGKLIEKKAD